MNRSISRPHAFSRSLILFIIVVALVAVGYGFSTWQHTRRVAEIATKGAQVMPFDLAQTTHHFQAVASGGVQTVTANDPANQQQVQLVRSHLQDEAARFAKGDFSDPGRLHGMNMPGATELSAGASHIHIQYAEIPAGGQITYTTQDPTLVRAIHTWFAAQISDHGLHDMPGMQP